MGLLGDIRYVLTKIHYECTTLRLCVSAHAYSAVCVHVCIYDEKQVWVACLFILYYYSIYYSIYY